MKKTLKLSAAIALTLAAAGAQASLTSTYDPSSSDPQNTPVNNGAGSSILLAVNDQLHGSANFGKTFLLDLALNDAGLNYASFVNGTQGTNGTLTWNLKDYAPFQALAADTAGLNWSVVGGSVLDANNPVAPINLNDISGGYPSTAAAPWGVVVTQKSTAGFTTGTYQGWNGLQEQTQTNTDSVAGTIDSANNSLSKLGAATNTVLAPAAGTGAFSYSAQLPYEGVVGANSVGFYFITNQNGFYGDGPDTNLIKQVGTFSLSSKDVLTFTSSASTAVPVPASAWMFATGLLAAFGVKRKQTRV